MTDVKLMLIAILLYLGYMNTEHLLFLWVYIAIMGVIAVGGIIRRVIGESNRED